MKISYRCNPKSEAKAAQCLSSTLTERQRHHSVNISKLNQVASYKKEERKLTAQITAHKLDSILSETNEITIFAAKRKRIHLEMENQNFINCQSTQIKKGISGCGTRLKSCRGGHFSNIIITTMHQKNMLAC